MEKPKRIAGLDDHSLSVCNCDKKKILNAVAACITAMSELTITESKVARKHLSCVMDDMYKRSSDTLIGTIQPRR